MQWSLVLYSEKADSLFSSTFKRFLLQHRMSVHVTVLDEFGMLMMGGEL